MSIKRAVIYVIIAIIVGVILGGISRIWDIDLDIYVMVIPVVVLIAISGSDIAISNKRNKKDSLKVDESKHTK